MCNTVLFLQLTLLLHILKRVFLRERERERDRERERERENTGSLELKIHVLLLVHCLAESTCAVSLANQYTHQRKGSYPNFFTTSIVKLLAIFISCYVVWVNFYSSIL